MNLIYLYFKIFKDFILLGFSSDGDIKFAKEILKHKKNGTYLDIGCYHPFKDSHTSYLYKNKWRGINVDISKETIEMFKILRPEDKNLNIGISTRNGYQNAYFEKSISTVSSLDPYYLKKIGRKPLERRKIKVHTLNKIIQLYSLKNIDFLKIDCEGLDTKIILNTNLKKLNFKFICIELLPQEVYGWGIDYPYNKSNQYFKNYFLKSKIYKKLKNDYKYYSNNKIAFLLINKNFI